MCGTRRQEGRRTVWEVDEAAVNVEADLSLVVARRQLVQVPARLV